MAWSIVDIRDTDRISTQCEQLCRIQRKDADHGKNRDDRDQDEKLDEGECLCGRVCALLYT